MARAELNDGQSLLAVNDLFIGQKTHASARYRIRFGGREEDQSSSGIIVSTGAGSTGWHRSILTGAAGIVGAYVEAQRAVELRDRYRFDWEAPDLVFHVREPFISKTSGAELVLGRIGPDEPLDVVSHMPQNGVIFSDGVEEDRLDFNSGAIARIGLAERTLRNGRPERGPRHERLRARPRSDAPTDPTPAGIADEATTVLVVDDSAFDRQLVGQLLDPMPGVRVVYADDGRAGLAAIAREAPSVILTDLVMPDMGGLELVQRVRADHPEIAVILMTAFGSEEVAMQTLRAGAANYIPKRDLARPPLDAAPGPERRLPTRDRRRILGRLVRRESAFRLDCDPALISALLRLIGEELDGLDFGDPAGRVQIGIALQRGADQRPLPRQPGGQQRASSAGRAGVRRAGRASDGGGTLPLAAHPRPGAARPRRRSIRRRR